MQINEDERMRSAIESGLFASALGANMGAKTMTIDALRNSPERQPAARQPAARQARASVPSPDIKDSLFSSLVTRSPLLYRQQAQVCAPNVVVPPVAQRIDQQQR